MPIDLAALGLILTFLSSSGLFGFLRTIFSEVDPKAASALLRLQADKLKNQLESMVFQEIDNDIQRSTLSLKKEDIKQREESLVAKRQQVASEITNRLWNHTTRFQELKAAYNSWNRTYSHGRLVATICTAIFFFLFALLATLIFTKTITSNIQNTYYWIALIIIFLPFAYIFICWLVTHKRKNNFEMLSEGFDKFMEVSKYD